MRYSRLSAGEIARLGDTELDEQPVIRLTSGRGRDKIYTDISLIPVVRRNGVPEKVVSFELQYSYGRAPASILLLFSSSGGNTGLIHSKYSWYIRLVTSVSSM